MKIYLIEYISKQNSRNLKNREQRAQLNAKCTIYQCARLSYTQMQPPRHQVEGFIFSIVLFMSIKLYGNMQNKNYLDLSLISNLQQFSGMIDRQHKLLEVNLPGSNFFQLLINAFASVTTSSVLHVLRKLFTVIPIRVFWIQTEHESTMKTEQNCQEQLVVWLQRCKL